MLCVTRNRLSAGLEREPGRIATGAARPSSRKSSPALRPVPTAVAPMFSSAQLPRRGRDIVAAAFDARGVAAELLTERDRHRILQVRPAGLEDVARTRRLARKAAGELARVAGRAAGAEQQRQARRRREDVVRGLAHVDVIVRMHARVDAARLAEDLGGAVGEHLVRVHVVRRAGARLVHVDDELIAEAARQRSRRRPATMARAISGSRRPSAAFASAAAFLTRTVAVTRSGGASQAADREILDGARGLHAVVRVGRDLQLAERIAFGAEAHKGR